MMRSLLSILAGYAVMVVLVIPATVIAVKVMLPATAMQSAMKLKPTTAYLAVNLIYSGLFAVVGGLVTGGLARRAPLAHAGALAVLMLLMGLVSFFQSKGTQQPAWYGVALMVLMPLGALLGGFLQILRQVH